MKGCIRVKILLFILFGGLILSSMHVVFAKDHLFLTGVVRFVDPSSGTLRINVTSEGCTGIREFKAPDNGAADLDASLIGKRIQFYIDSTVCERGKVHTIVPETLP